MVKDSEIDRDQAPYDFIIMDLNMPILNGHEACQQIVNFYQLLDRDILSLENNDLGEIEMLSDNAYQEKRWLVDLKVVFYDYLCELNQS